MSINKDIDISGILNTIDNIEIVAEKVRGVCDSWSETVKYDIIPELLAKKLNPDLIVGSYEAITSFIVSRTHKLSSAEYQNTVSEFDHVENGKLIATYTVLKLICPEVLKLILVPVDMEDKLYVIDTNNDRAGLAIDWKCK